MKFKIINRYNDDPSSLLCLYITTAVVSVITIILLSSISFYRIFSGVVLKSAEADALHVSHLLLDKQLADKFHPVKGQGDRLVIEKAVLPQFDQEIRTFLHPFNIIKIKIYDAEQRIIYSTEPSLIGKTDNGNIRLKNSLAGNTDSKQVTKDNAHDLANEPLMDVDVVETYVPIRRADLKASGINLPGAIENGKVLGSFELYVNVTRYRDQIRTGVFLMTIITVGVLVGVFGFSYLLIRRGTLHLKDVQNRLEMLAITDGLTGIANRGYVMKRGDEEFARAERNKDKGSETPTLCCIMLDIDHFKKVNDTKGHPAGDEVLREVVCRMQQSVRPYDIVGRYGGEEFLLLLPDTAVNEGVVVAERIRTDISREHFIVAGDEIFISVSLGISCFDKKDQKLGDLLKRADDGLYKAKFAGRDRVELVYSSSDAAEFA